MSSFPCVRVERWAPSLDPLPEGLHGSLFDPRANIAAAPDITKVFSPFVTNAVWLAIAILASDPLH
jgi:hypothetical protein